MKGSFVRKLVFSCIAAALILTSLPVTAGTKDVADNPAQKLLAIGQPGPKAIDLKVSERKTGDGDLGPGDPMAVTVKASRKGYLTAVHVSRKGDVVVLLPNKKTQDSLVSPDKEWPLAGAASLVKLIKSRRPADSGRVVLFVSSRPLNLDSFSMRENQNFLSIPRSSSDQIAALVDKLQLLSKDGEFNRVLLANDVSVGGAVLNLMGAPPGVRSSRPGGTVGVQGVKQKIRDLGKE